MSDKQKKQPAPLQPNHRQERKDDAGRTIAEDRKPQNIESAQPRREQPGDKKPK